MKKFEGYLFTTDLDGTLLRYDKSISKENLDAIEYFKSEGGLFTFITGRIPMGAKHIYDIVKPNAPCGCINGGGIYDYRTEEFLWYDEVPESVMELVEYIDKNLPEMGIEVNTFDKIYFCKKSDATEKHRTDEKFEDLTCHYLDIKEPISKILFAHDNEKLIHELIKMLRNHPLSNNFDFIRSDALFYEVLPKGSSKGKLLEKIAEICGIDRKNTIAVGDNDNDASMLLAAGKGFAVMNASDSAKKAADFITVSNEENAIAEIIYSIDKF